MRGLDGSDVGCSGGVIGISAGTRRRDVTLQQIHIQQSGSGFDVPAFDPPRRMRSEELAANGCLGPPLGDIGIGALSSDDVNRWYAGTLVDKPTTRAHAYGLLHAVCATAVENELLAKNPCQIKRAMTTKRKRERVLLSVSEFCSARASRSTPLHWVAISSADENRCAGRGFVARISSR
jgi:hypothetical protein